jgi:hypothetical protein
MPRETHPRQRSADLCTVVVQRNDLHVWLGRVSEPPRDSLRRFSPYCRTMPLSGRSRLSMSQATRRKHCSASSDTVAACPGQHAKSQARAHPRAPYGSSPPCSKGPQRLPIIDDPHAQHLGRRSDPLWCRVLRRAGPQTGCGSREPAPALIQPPGVWDGRRIGIKRMRWRRINEPMPVTT